MSVTLNSLLDSDFIHVFRKERALPFISRLADIEHLVLQIADKSEQIEGDERTLTRRLSEPPPIRVPIPWEKDEHGKPKEVSFEEAVPLFQERERILYKEVAQMVPGGDEIYENGFSGYKPLIQKAIAAQIKEYRAKIKKQLETIKEVEAGKKRLYTRIREYVDFADQYHGCVQEGISKQIIRNYERLIVQPNLSFQDGCASKIQRAYRKHSEKIERLLSQLHSIQFAFHDYQDIQSHIIAVQKRYEDSLYVEIGGHIMHYNDAADLYEQKIKQADESEDMEGMARLDVEFKPLFDKIGEIHQLSREISDSTLELGQKKIQFKKAVEKLDAFYEQNPGIYKNPRIADHLGMLSIFKHQILGNEELIERGSRHSV